MPHPGALENEFGRPLFTRGRSGVCPTELGTELYRSSQLVLKEMTALEQHIQAFIRSDSKRLNIGLAAGFRYLSPSNARKLWSAFESKHPQILVQSREYHYVEGLELLENQTLDLLTFSDYTAGENYTQHPLKTWERVLLVPQGHPLYDREFVELSDLKGERLVFPPTPRSISAFWSSVTCTAAIHLKLSGSATPCICMRPVRPTIASVLPSTAISATRFSLSFHA